jgi:hypothetical protein
LLGLSAATPNADFLMAVGDIITGTVTIADGPVQLSGPPGSIAQVQLEFASVGSNFTVTSDSTVSLIGLTGLTNQMFTGSEEGSGVLAVMDIDGPAYDFSFSQFDYTVVVTSVFSWTLRPRKMRSMAIQYLRKQHHPRKRRTRA